MTAATTRVLAWAACSALSLGVCSLAPGAPVVTRLTPPSDLFSFNDPHPPVIARFLPGQRFDLQATVRPDAGQAITSAEFLVDGKALAGSVALTAATVAGQPAGTTVATRRAYSHPTAGIHTFTVRAVQTNGTSVSATGNFEIVAIGSATGVTLKARNIILLIGDGMGIAHRTAARIVAKGVSQGKSLAPLAMEQLPVTGIVTTASLDSIVTDSAPGAACYSTGNKNANNQEGVFPDDTTDAFDNPRIENIGEYFARLQGRSLGIVTTADVSDATPGAFGAHTQNRGAGTGIVDQFFDEGVSRANLAVLLGGGRKWFLPSTTPGSGRGESTDYVLPAELAAGWTANAGAIDPARDLLATFKTAGFSYVPDATALKAVPAGTTKLLGLFALSHMNVALDKIAGRRGDKAVVTDAGFADQPMLDEMTDAALAVLSRGDNGFVLMVEGATIDKNAHFMDSERWILDVIEFDRAVDRARLFAQANPDTLVIVTADHETGGANVIGASSVSNSSLKQRAAAGGGAAELRDPVVGVMGAAGFPDYDILSDGYPRTTEVDRRVLIGYGANADRYEDWLGNPKPIRGAFQAANDTGQFSTYPGGPTERDKAGAFLVTGQVPGAFAVHTGSDVPLSAAGAGSAQFTGVMDNTDVFFRMVKAALVGEAVTLTTLATTPISAAASASTEQMVSVSTRGHVGTDANILIAGFAVRGSRARTFVIRGVGPSLARLGVRGVLANPVLRVVDGGGNVVATNEQWGLAPNLSTLVAASSSAGTFALETGSKDAALVLSLPPGNYTVQVSGAGGTTGVALVEIYEIR